MIKHYKVGDFYHDNNRGYCIIKEVLNVNKIKIEYTEINVLGIKVKRTLIVNAY